MEAAGRKGWGRIRLALIAIDVVIAFVVLRRLWQETLLLRR